MTDDARDARRALGEIERAQDKSRVLQGYAHAWPIFVVWGLVWFAANTAHYLNRFEQWAWPIGILIGTGLTLFFVLRMSREIGRSTESPTFKRRFTLRFAAQAVVIMAGVAAMFTILDPPNPAQMNAAISLFVAIAYMVQGLYHGARIFIAGLAVAAAVLVGYHVFREAFELWMAFVGGGMLIATGLWLRTAA